jgi:hypothetical protein
LTADANIDAETLLKQSLSGWDPQGGTIRLSLTKFALIDLEQKHVVEGSATRAEVPAFMLQNALTYGYNDVFWWSKVTDPKVRLTVASQLLGRDNKVINERVVRHIVQDDQIRSLKVSLPEKMILAMLDVARRSNDPSLQHRIFDTLRALTPAAKQWRVTALGDTSDKHLAALVLTQSPISNEAAKLIGHLRSQLAVETIVKGTKGERRNTALLTIRQEAGSLPKTIPQSIRLGVTGEWMMRRLTGQPLDLLTIYAWIALGVALSFGLQAYLTYRLPRFFDALRIISSLERGIILGIIFGFGIFVTRVIVERFPESNILLRVGLGTGLGGVMLNIAIFTYYVLLNDTVPQGILISVSCVFIAFGYAAGGAVRHRPVGMLISGTMVMAALVGSWWGHIYLTRVSVTMTPIFFYEYLWSTTQVLLTMLIVALPMAILGNLGDLSPQRN